MPKRRRAIVTGRVQGVGFRWYTREKANDLGLTGWVRNLHDGRVETAFQGDPALVAEMETWLWKGAPAARVVGVTLSEEAPVPGEIGRAHV